MGRGGKREGEWEGEERERVSGKGREEWDNGVKSREGHRERGESENGVIVQGSKWQISLFQQCMNNERRCRCR